MTDTALDVIKDALRDLGVVGKAHDIDEDDAARGLQALNDLIEGWSLEALVLHAHTDVTHVLVASDPDYTIGPSGADITAARPTGIVSGFVRDGSSNDHPLAVVSYLDYQRHVDKTTETDLPDEVAYNPTHPSGTLYLFPTPNTGNTLHLIVEALLSTLAATTTTFTMPPGYRRALRKGLALEAASMFGQDARVKRGTLLYEQAKESKAWLKRANARNRVRRAKLDPTLLAMSAGTRGGGYNINTDG